MIEYLLGNFMVNTGIITKEDFERVLEIQDRERMKIGVLAVLEGYMTSPQTRQVHFAQTMMDKKFGEIAIEKGFLSEEQVEELLEKQGNEYLTFIQQLIDEDLCSVEEADAILYGFQIEHGFTEEDMMTFKRADVEGIVNLFIPEEAYVYRNIAETAVRTIIRCIDRNAYIGQAYITDHYEAKAPVIQVLEGDDTFSTAIADVNGGMCNIASVYGRFQCEALDEDAQDACGEFLNCINGLYVSSESKKRQEYELLPPEMEGKKTLCSDATFVLPIYMKDKEIAFVVTENRWNQLGDVSITKD